LSLDELFKTSVFFGAFITLLSYGIGCLLKRRFKLTVFNPLLIAVLLTILFLAVFRVDYATYHEGAKYISFLLTPATVCLAVPLYEQIELLKKNYKAVLVGILSGVFASLLSILILAVLFRFDHASYVTLLPKSITTAIGMEVSRELGGYVPITVAVIIVTGVIGNIFADTVCRIFRIRDPIARGIALGTSSHAIGTARAMEMGEVEGAMSSLSIVVAGILTVAGAGVFAKLL
jgi:Putative effector of murein hydrolase